MIIIKMLSLAEQINGIFKDEFLFPICSSENILKQLIKEAKEICENI